MQHVIKEAQPPSGGCVLKLCFAGKATSRDQPPSGGCVLKLRPVLSKKLLIPPAAFRRLCVETGVYGALSAVSGPSRLQAAVC